MAMQRAQSVRRVGVYGLVGSMMLLWTSVLFAADKAEKTYQLVVTDQQGIETELKTPFFTGKKK